MDVEVCRVDTVGALFGLELWFVVPRDDYARAVTVIAFGIGQFVGCGIVDYDLSREGHIA